MTIELDRPRSLYKLPSILLQHQRCHCRQRSLQPSYQNNPMQSQVEYSPVSSHTSFAEVHLASWCLAGIPPRIRNDLPTNHEIDRKVKLGTSMPVDSRKGCPKAHVGNRGAEISLSGLHCGVDSETRSFLPVITLNTLTHLWL